MFCSRCGKEIADDAGFCQYCEQQVGASIQQQSVCIQQEKEPKSQFVALFLCLFLGLVGIHDFYMGKNKSAIIKLLLTVFLGWIYIGLIINVIWCILDFLLIITKAEDCFYTKKELEEKEEARKREWEEYRKRIEEKKQLEIEAPQKESNPLPKVQTEIKQSQNNPDKIIEGKAFIIPIIVAIVLFILLGAEITNNKAKNNELYQNAITAYENKDYALAKTHIEELYKKNPKFKDTAEKYKSIRYDYYMLEGNKKLKNKQYKEALNNFTTAKYIIVTKDAENRIVEANQLFKNQQETLKKQMYFDVDKVTGDTWIRDKAAPKYINTNAFYPYIGKSKDYAWLRLKVCYYGDDWIFWGKMIFNVDGAQKSYTLNYGEVKHDNDTMVWEYADLQGSEYRDLLEQIANSKNTILRLEGNSKHFDRTITSTEKQVIKRTLEYFDTLNN